MIEAEQWPEVPEYPGARQHSPAPERGVPAAVARLRRQREASRELEEEVRREAGGGEGSLYEAYSALEHQEEPGLLEAQRLDPGFERTLQRREAAGWTPPPLPGLSARRRGSGSGGGGGGRGGEGGGGLNNNRLTHEGLLAKAEARARGARAGEARGARPQHSPPRRRSRSGCARRSRCSTSTARGASRGTSCARRCARPRTCS